MSFVRGRMTSDVISLFVDYGVGGQGIKMSSFIAVLYMTRDEYSVTEFYFGRQTAYTL